MQLMQMMAQMGPEVMARIDNGVLLDMLMRQSGVYEPGLIKSEEQVQEEMQQMQQQQIEQAAAQKAIDVQGDVVAQNVMSQEPTNV